MSSASDLELLRREFDDSLAAVSEPKGLVELRNAWLSKKGGKVTGALQALRGLPAEEKPAFGQAVNVLKQHVETALKERQAELERQQTADRLSAEAVDPTLPGRPPDVGGLHPIRLIQDEIEAIFTGLGYSVMHGPEIEDEHHNFEALNVPADHPARDDQDTFYLVGHLLRTHTSPVQIRTMAAQDPPVRIICPGRVYRRDWDASHSPMFHQFEGLVIGEDVSFADLKGTMDLFFKRLLGDEVETRLRPSFFPFTEPSAEVDISCRICGASGCPACKQTGWIEVMGSGMVHPAVLEAVGYDPERWQGFAFGGGIDRMAMLKYGVPNIHLFFENDIRFLRQYR
jgi:phenylalanyl-tRNA synthetase alpha chain